MKDRDKEKREEEDQKYKQDKIKDKLMRIHGKPFLAFPDNKMF